MLNELSDGSQWEGAVTGAYTYLVNRGFDTQFLKFAEHDFWG